MSGPVLKPWVGTRDCRINVSATEAEREEIRDVSSGLGLSMSQYLCNLHHNFKGREFIEVNTSGGSGNGEPERND